MIQKIRKSPICQAFSLTLILSVLFFSFNIKPQIVVLRAGTPIPLETISEINSGFLMTGQIIDFRIRSDIMVDGKVVIRGGTIAKGQVVRVQKAKGVGKEGYVEIQIKSVTAVDNQIVLLSGGSLYQDGDNKQTLAIVLGVLVCILFLLIKGKNAIIPPGLAIDSSAATEYRIEVD